ncbi:MAG TPA: methionine--tRNA ligase subunit beta [Candidatus Paceibacterota bacterium]|nr:methionine--tRNA ligase subunit beta [Candidatus Paceibacterota bacterium]
MDYISIDDVKKVEMRVGEILNAERIEGSEKLLKLKVNFGAAPEGLGERQVLSGIAAYVQPEALVGKRYPFVTNLAPRMMMGLESQAMIVATGGGEDQPLYLFETEAPAGSVLR